MKVLLVAPLPPPIGGIQSVTETMVGFVNEHPCGVNLKVQDTSHHIRPVTSESMFVRLFTGIFNSLQTFFQVRKNLQQEKPDLIHLASSASLAMIKDLLIVRTARRRGVPVVMHWHFGRIPCLKEKQNREWNLLIKLIHESAWSIVLDEKSVEALNEAGCTNVSCIPNPLAQEVEVKARELSENPIFRHTGRIIYVGHVIKDKGIYELVEACVTFPQVKELLLIGPYEDAIRKDLEKIARKREAGQWLLFEGQQNKEQVLDNMAQSPILALPSYTEGFPMVILEAMAMGCAIIAADVGAVSTMLAANTHSACGVCIPPKNVDQLQGAIADLMRKPSMMELYGSRGRQRVLGAYSVGNVFTQYKNCWQTIISNKAP